jgi:hypothetical protein
VAPRLARFVCGAALAACGLSAGLGAQAQPASASAPVVTAAFLLNFVKFVDWPVDALSSGAPLVMCVADPAVADAVTRAVAAGSSGGRTLQVSRVAPGTGVPGECHVFYAADLDARRTDGVIATLGTRSVLAVGNTEDFTRRGGTIHLFIEDGSMRFAVNPQAAERARLRVSSRLLSLARIVKDGL